MSYAINNHNFIHIHLFLLMDYFLYFEHLIGVQTG